MGRVHGWEMYTHAWLSRFTSREGRVKSVGRLWVSVVLGLVQVIAARSTFRLQIQSTSILYDLVYHIYYAFLITWPEVIIVYCNNLSAVSLKASLPLHVFFRLREGKPWMRINCLFVFIEWKRCMIVFLNGCVMSYSLSDNTILNQSFIHSSAIFWSILIYFSTILTKINSLLSKPSNPFPITLHNWNCA